MQIRYYKEYSRFLNRFMEFKVYGHAGRPIVIFPCQSGRFFDWEDRNMCNAAAPWIDSGKLQIFTVDSIDPESWDNNGPERPRIEMQERWYNYICEEFVPRLLEINREQGEDHTGCILTGGAAWAAATPSTSTCAAPTSSTARLPERPVLLRYVLRQLHGRPCLPQFSLRLHAQLPDDSPLHEAV